MVNSSRPWVGASKARSYLLCMRMRTFSLPIRVQVLSYCTGATMSSSASLFIFYVSVDANPPNPAFNRYFVARESRCPHRHFLIIYENEDRYKS